MRKQANQKPGPDCQAVVLQVVAGSFPICGVLIKRHLVECRQEIRTGRDGLVHGQSVTDEHNGWNRTETVLENLAAALRRR